ncbi:hypothetical protein GCM10009638_17590 [Luteococcus sanguinis]
MELPSSDARESRTRESQCRQKGQYMARFLSFMGTSFMGTSFRGTSFRGTAEPPGAGRAVDLGVDAAVDIMWTTTTTCGRTTCL